MSLWRRSRTEVSGAWRSLRYDLSRRRGPELTSPDLTSPELTVDHRPVDHRPARDPIARPPRRLLAAAVLGVLALVGAAGSYLAVVHGLGTLLSDPVVAHVLPVPAETTPQHPRTPSSGGSVPTARIGHDTSVEPSTGRTPAVPRAAAVAVRPRPSASPTPPMPTRRPVRASTPPTTGTPPESTRTPPSPTSPPAPSGSPTGAEPTASPSALPSSGQPSPSTTPAPSGRPWSVSPAPSRSVRAHQPAIDVLSGRLGAHRALTGRAGVPGIPGPRVGSGRTTRPVPVRTQLWHPCLLHLRAT